MENRFRGVGTALVTPFRNDGSLDEEALRSLIDFQIQGGVDFLVPCGTTGESVTLDGPEYQRVVGLTVEAAAGRVPVLAGAGSNNTAKAIHQTEQSARAGAAGTLHVAPYYNKPTQEGLYRHFRAVSEAAPLPVVLYNIPSRTGVNLDVETTLRLADIPAVVAVKEASGNLAQMMEVAARAPAGFDLLSGDDSWTLAVLALGGKGLISVVSNQIPGPIKQMVDAGLRNDLAAARVIHEKYLTLMTLNFIETNPIPVKAGLALMGLIEENYRLPMAPMKPENRARLEAEMRRLGLIRDQDSKSRGQGPGVRGQGY